MTTIHTKIIPTTWMVHQNIQQLHQRRRRRRPRLTTGLEYNHLRMKISSSFLSILSTFLLLYVSVFTRRIDAFQPLVTRTTARGTTYSFANTKKKNFKHCDKRQLAHRRLILFMSSDKIVNNNNNVVKINHQDKIRLLGKGSDAIVKLGAVIIPPVDTYHHFYRQSAIFIYDMGYDNTNGNDQNNVRLDPNPIHNDQTYYIRGVILDHPTPFTVSEMIPNISNEMSLVHHNLMFRGGDRGRENSVILLHNNNHHHGSNASGTEIGASGIYIGGFNSIMNSHDTTSSIGSNDNIGNNHNYKFFFNYCEFTENEIEALFCSPSVDNNDNDQWISVEIVNDPSSIILNNEWDRGDCYRYIRNTIVQMK